MNRIKSLVFVAVAAILQTAPSLTAQQQVFDAKVPFQFSAGDTTLAAGEYRITRRNAFLNIQNSKDNSAAVILASNADSPSDGQVHLVFDYVNDLFFLRKVVAPSSFGSIELAVSSAEKKARMDQRRLSTAILPAATATVAAIGAQ